MNPTIPHTWGDGRPISLAISMSDIMTEIEELFGPRDKNFMFVGVEFVPGRPHIFFPAYRNHISIRLSMGASEFWNTAVHELAHECVHLLSPIIGTPANNLEEGVATWYSFDYYRRVVSPDAGEISPDYKEAYDAVSSLFGYSEQGPKVIRQLRNEEPHLYAITAESILRFAPKLPRTLADFLVNKWDTLGPKRS